MQWIDVRRVAHSEKAVGVEVFTHKYMIVLARMVFGLPV
jgi:hypothetical protein